jgi:hypothetical protein
MEIRKPRYASEDTNKLVNLLWELKKGKKSKVVNFRLSEDFYKFMQVIADIENTTVSQIVLEGALLKAVMHMRNYEGPIHGEWMEMFPEYFGEKY